MGLMAIESGLSRRELIFPFARKKRADGGQPPGRPDSRASSPQPEPPDGGFKVTRREIIIAGCVLLGGGAVTAILKPWTWFTSPPEPEVKPILTPTPTTTTPEALDSRLLNTIEERILRLGDYTLNLRQKMRGFWIQGINGTVQYSTKDNKNYLFSFAPAQADDKMQDLAKTTIILERRDLSSGGSALVFSLAGFYNPLLEDKRLDLDTQTKLQSMNLDHEALVSISTINGLIAVAEGLGLNFAFPSDKVADEDAKLLQLRAYLPRVATIAEAVAEINDYILTYPLLDKNPQTGNILYARIPGNQAPLPLIKGKAFLETGLTFIVDSTIGLSLKQFSSWEQLFQKYPRLQDIPNYKDYLTKIEQHYKSLYQ